MFQTAKLLTTAALILANISAAAGSASFTKEDVLNIWRDQEGRLSDFYVDFDFEEMRKGEDGSIVAHKRENIAYLAKANLFRTRKRVFDSESGEPKRDWEISADGKREYFCDRPACYGTVKDTLPKQAGIQNTWAIHYLTCVYRMPRQEGNYGRVSNVISILEDPRTEISEEVFNGRKAVVLTQPGYAKVYLDPKLNFAVLGGEAAGHPKLTFKFKNADFVEVEEGIWMPKQAERTFRNGSQLVVRKTSVNEISVNNSFTSDDFRISFEPAIRVRDIDLGIYITPSAKDMNDFYLDSLLALAQDANFIDVYHVGETPVTNSATPETNIPQPPEGGEFGPSAVGDLGATGRSCSWQMIVTFISLAITAVVLVSYWLRKRKKALDHIGS